MSRGFLNGESIVDIEAERDELLATRTENHARIARLVSEKLELERRLSILRDGAEAIDKRLDDPHGDGSGDGAQPPTGDNYNDLMDLVRNAVRSE